MGMERTLVIVKPDGVQRGLVGPILSRLEARGLKMVGLKLMQVSQQLASVNVSNQLPLQQLWTFDGISPGPTYVAHYGTPILIRNYNNLPSDKYDVPGQNMSAIMLLTNWWETTCPVEGLNTVVSVWLDRENDTAAVFQT